jgi:hypothetical protein
MIRAELSDTLSSPARRMSRNAAHRGDLDGIELL